MTSSHLAQSSPDHVTHSGPRLVVAFQGERGAYADSAIDRVWGARVERLSCGTFVDVVQAVLSGRAGAGVLPLHNSIIGPIPGVAAALQDVVATGTGGIRGIEQGELVQVPVVHCLLGNTGARLNEVRRVYSHPAALQQCRHFFAAHDWLTAVASYDTAGAAREVAAGGRADEAAIAAEGCAARYGLQVLARDIADEPENVTTFVVVAPRVRSGGV